VTTPPPHKNIELRRRQFKAADDKEFCLQLARAFVSGKIRNARTLLRRNARELPRETLVRLAYARRDAERAVALEQLLGIEGAAARDYFGSLSLMFKTNGGRELDTEPLEEEIPSAEHDVESAIASSDSRPWARFDFTKRNRRPPRDPVNARAWTRSPGATRSNVRARACMSKTFRKATVCNCSG
jgi:CRISPR-associated protein Cas1